MVGPFIGGLRVEVKRVSGVESGKKAVATVRTGVFRPFHGVRLLCGSILT